MPRRRPLKAGVLALDPTYQFSVIRGMSSRLLADIRELEAAQQDFWPRSVEAAFRLWKSYLGNPWRHLVDFDGDNRCGVYECCGNPLEGRALLRKAVSVLPAPTAKELRRFIAKTAERHAA